jgi:hypothetical protein
MTADVYGRLFPLGDDTAEPAAAKKPFLISFGPREIYIKPGRGARPLPGQLDSHHTIHRRANYKFLRDETASGRAPVGRRCRWSMPRMKDWGKTLPSARASSGQRCAQQQPAARRRSTKITATNFWPEKAKKDPGATAAALWAAKRPCRGQIARARPNIGSELASVSQITASAKSIVGEYSQRSGFRLQK